MKLRQFIGLFAALWICGASATTVQDITAKQGAALNVTLAGAESSLQGRTLRMHVRKTFASTSTKFVASTSDGRLTVGSTPYTSAALSVGSDVLAAVPVTAPVEYWVYDVESYTTATDVRREWSGKFTITRDVTRDTEAATETALSGAVLYSGPQSLTADQQTQAWGNIGGSEQARDAIGAALVAGSGMTVTVSDAGDTITLVSSGGGGGGDDGWSPVFAVETDLGGSGITALRVDDWTGGSGTKPATGQYVGTSGLVNDIGDAANIRGPQGSQGDAGAAGSDGADGADGADGTAINFSDTAHTSSPNATVNVSSLVAIGATANVGAVLGPKGTGSISGHVPDGTATGGNARGAYAVDWQTSRSDAGNVAATANSVIAGGSDNIAASTGQVISGGAGNQGYSTWGVIGGGLLHYTSGGAATVGGGQGNQASNDYATTAGGRDNFADGAYSTISGGYRATARGIYGADVYASGQRAARGDHQRMELVARGTTTGAASTALTTDGGSAGGANQLILPNNSAATVLVKVTGNVRGASGMWGSLYVIDIKRGANAAATAIEGTPTTVHSTNTTGGTVTFVLTADTTNGGLRGTATGDTGLTIDWTAHIESVGAVE